jgi:beta-glucosidase
MLEGKYTDGYSAHAGADPPKFTDAEQKIIASPLDFVGINVYWPIAYVLADDVPPGWREIPFAKAHPKMFNSWLALGPEAIYPAPKFVQSLWGAKEIHITENGCGRDDASASVARQDRCSIKDFSDVRRLREAKSREITWHGRAPVHEGLARM